MFFKINVFTVNKSLKSSFNWFEVIPARFTEKVSKSKGLLFCLGSSAEEHLLPC